MKNACFTLVMLLLKMIEVSITINQPIMIKHMKSKSIDAGNNTKSTNQSGWLLSYLEQNSKQNTDNASKNQPSPKHWHSKQKFHQLSKQCKLCCFAKPEDANTKNAKLAPLIKQQFIIVKMITLNSKQIFSIVSDKKSRKTIMIQTSVMINSFPGRVCKMMLR